MVYTVPNNVRFERGDQVLLVDPAKPNWAILNRLGAEALAALESAGPSVGLDDVAESLAASWGSKLRKVKRDLNQFVDHLTSIDFLSPDTLSSDEAGEVYPGRAQVVAPGRLGELWIYTNRSCNLACSHCFLGDWPRGAPILSTDEVKRVLVEGRDLGVKRFFFTGGEPFARKDLAELILFTTEELGADLAVLTNGTLLSDNKTLDRIADVNRARLTVQVSLEGPNSEVNDAIRGAGAFDKALAGIRNLKSRSLSTVVATVLTRANVATIHEMPALLAELGVRHFHVHWLYPDGRATTVEEPLDLESEPLAEAMLRLKAEAERHGVVVDNFESLRMRVLARRGRKSDLCNACFEMLSVDIDGAVYACAPATGDEALRLGSLTEQSLEAIWRGSERAQALRRLTVVDKPECERCTFMFLCGGGCLFRSFLGSDGTALGLTGRDDLCEAYRTLAESVIWETVDEADAGGGGPRVLAHMGTDTPHCETYTKTIGLDWEVGTFHCSCFLAADVETRSGRAKKGAASCFSDLAPSYDAWAAGPLGQAYAQAVEQVWLPLVAAEPGKRVLEVGCGTGNYLLPLAAMGVTAVGVDGSDAMLRVAHQKAKTGCLSVHLEHAFAEALPFPEASFDVVYSINALEFVDNQEAAVAEMLRVLVPGGTLLVAALSRRSLWGVAQRLKRPFAAPDKAYYRGHFVTRRELAELVRAERPDAEVEVLGTISFPPINSASLLRVWRSWPLNHALGLLPDAVLIARTTKV